MNKKEEGFLLGKEFIGPIYKHYCNIHGSQEDIVMLLGKPYCINCVQTLPSMELKEAR